MKKQETPGMKRAVELLRGVSGKSRNEVLKNVGQSDTGLSRELEAKMLTFEDLDGLDDRELQTLVLRVAPVDRELLALALRKCDFRLGSRLMRNMPQQLRDSVSYRVETMPKRPLSVVEDAQRKIVLIAKQLSDAGEIALNPSEPHV